MLSHNSSGISSGPERPEFTHRSSTDGVHGLNLNRQLQQLEEIVLDSPRFPLTRRTMVDEDQLLDHLDQLRLSLPEAFQEAESILQTKEVILAQAHQYAQEVVKAAEQRAAQIADEVKIIQQAELEAQRILQAVQAECETVRQRTVAELQQIRLQAQQEVQQMRQATLADCEQLQSGADAYADRVLSDMEQQLSQVLQVIRHSRHHLQEAAAQPHPPAKITHSPRAVEQSPGVDQ